MDRRERILVGLLAVAAVGAGIYYGYSYFWGNYVSWGQQIDENVQRIKEAQREASQIEQLVEDVINTRRELKKSRRRLPQQGEFYTLLAKLEQQARDAGIPDDKIITFSRSQTRSRGMVKVMGISAQFEQISLDQAVQMLWKFKNMERLVDLNNFQMSPQETEEGGFVFNLNMTLNVYMLQDTNGETAEA
jgi:Tfp pilus assembly protein PilO